MTDHLTDVELCSFAAGRLPADEMLRADDHLFRCSQCRSRAVAVNDAATHVRNLQAQLTEPDTHVSDDELQLLVQGRLPAAAKRGIADHVKECAVCAAQVNELRSWATAGAGRRVYLLAMAAIIVLAILVPAAIWQGRPRPPKSAGSLAGLEELAPADRAVVRAALAAGAAQPPTFMAEIAPQRETLMGRSSEPAGAFDLIAPLATGVVSDTPAFEWQPLAGAGGYIVTVADERSNVVLRSPVVTTTRWMASTPLPRAVTYTWQVAAHRGRETITAPAAPAPPARFRVIDAERAEVLQQLERDHPGSHLLLGILYMNAGIRAEATRQFELVAPEDSRADVARQSLEALHAVGGYETVR